MTALPMKLTFNRLHWLVPSEERAFDGWLEGMPTDAQREAVLTRARAERAAWKPSVEAWTQFSQLQCFVGQRITIQFWSPVMYALAEEEWPTRVEAHCEGAITLKDHGFLQAYLVLRDPINGETGGPSESPYLVKRSAINCTLAPLADIYEVEAIADTA